MDASIQFGSRVLIQTDRVVIPSHTAHRCLSNVRLMDTLNRGHPEMFLANSQAKKKEAILVDPKMAPIKFTPY